MTAKQRAELEKEQFWWRDFAYCSDQAILSEAKKATKALGGRVPRTRFKQMVLIAKWCGRKS
jgi:hypothetical protein